MAGIAANVSELMKPVIIHPLLFALYPVLSLYLQNAQRLAFSEAVGTILLVPGAAMLFWLLAGILVKDRNKAAFIVSVFLILFFSYGHIYNVSRSLSANFQSLLLLGECLAFGISVFFTATSASDFRVATKLLNIISVVLLAALLGSQLYLYSYVFRSDDKVNRYIEDWERQTRPEALPANISSITGSLPDIYYIILDGYGREDVLDALYHLDNSDFLTALQDMGFYVAGQSVANYGQTALSLSSSLNFTYLDGLADAIGRENRNVLPLEAMIDGNRVFQHLRRLGYTVVTFASGFPFTEIANTDRYYSPPWSLNAFQNELISTTPLPLLLNLTSQKTQYDLHRERINYTLDHLADIAQLDAPTFTFAHILAPHPPFVFDATGEPVLAAQQRPFSILDGDIPVEDRDEYVRQYRDQVTYISARVLAMVSDILSKSPVPPVIILQGDHGPGSTVDWQNIQNTDFRERLSIFNAYYFPDRDYTALYPGISPVNTFRAVLNKYFGTHYELLKDKSYLSPLSQYYSFVDVTKDVQSAP
jgi:hypothetical protein